MSTAKKLLSLLLTFALVVNIGIPFPALAEGEGGNAYSCSGCNAHAHSGGGCNACTHPRGGCNAHADP